MKTIKQPVKLTIDEIKVDPHFDEITKQQQRHGVLLPGNIRAIICGPSNCGKTNALMNLLYNENGLASVSYTHLTLPTIYSV